MQAPMSSSLPSNDPSITSPPSQPDDRSAPAPKTSSALTTGSSNSASSTSTNATTEAVVEPEKCEIDGSGIVRKKMAKLLEGKEQEWTAVVEKQKAGPLQLLDLPMDILKEIVKEVTHTNDLAALALTHSALHTLAIPHIYSRFDIVWPDSNSTTDTRTGVDALTYGLATLVMGHDVLDLPTQTGSDGGRTALTPCTQCGALNPYSAPNRKPGQRRLGNHYPQFTRKFSLGNGPSDWVQDYMITKESGKMLGTLVALAIARMINLETFIWDMPTGVLRDVWLALASLERKSPAGECRLERVLVRWHDNSIEPSPSPANSNVQSIAPFIPPGSTVTPVGILLSSSGLSSAMQGLPHASTVVPIHNPVEYPTLSVLPPLKSLSVLDVDELSYLDEMSILIEKSRDCLQELRVGISKKAQFRDFVLAWDGEGLEQVDHKAKWPGAASAIGEKRLGGVLGILLGRVYDIRKKKSGLPSRHKRSHLASESIKESFYSEPVWTEVSQNAPVTEGVPEEEVAPIEDGDHIVDPTIQEVDASHFVPQSTTTTHVSSFTPGSEDLLEEPQTPVHQAAEDDITTATPSPTIIKHTTIHQTVSRFCDGSKFPASDTDTQETDQNQRAPLNGKLKLQVLELERVPLSVAVLQRAFDWTMLTSLTILDCAYNESMWRMLKRQFPPRPAHINSGLGYSAPYRPGVSSSSSRHKTSSYSVPMEYQLNLKKVHTDIATPALISFLKETLAPNTLEVLFLQDRRKTTPSQVSIDAIYRGPLRRHRKSLKKVLIDSSDKIPRSPSSSSDSGRWRTWMLTIDAMKFITSGDMCSLRELSVAIDYKHWHYFLRRLPQMTTLRSLNIPFIGDHITPAYDPRELAMQVVDVIFLRPEVELCYLGISNKCFEIIESRKTPATNYDEVTGPADGPSDHLSDDDDDGDGSDDDVEDDDDEEDEDEGTATEAVEADGSSYPESDPWDSDAESSQGSVDDRHKMSLRLREILFYDDRIAIFKARHMRL